MPLFPVTWVGNRIPAFYYLFPSPWCQCSSSRKTCLEVQGLLTAAKERPPHTPGQSVSPAAPPVRASVRQAALHLRATSRSLTTRWIPGQSPLRFSSLGLFLLRLLVISTPVSQTFLLAFFLRRMHPEKCLRCRKRPQSCSFAHGASWYPIRNCTTYTRPYVDLNIRVLFAYLISNMSQIVIAETSFIAPVRISLRRCFPHCTMSSTAMFTDGGQSERLMLLLFFDLFKDNRVISCERTA